MELLSLKEMCNLLHVTRRTIQGYEQAGLLKDVDKNKYGHLLYDDACLDRARKVRYFQELGFTLGEIKELIDAPEWVLREALERKVKELMQEMEHLRLLVEKTEELLKSL
jgi:DNA-binding transcriptional MerR regulator